MSETGHELPGLCIFDGRAASSVVLWRLSEEQARAEGRPIGAMTVYALCEFCGEDFDSERAEAAERAIASLDSGQKGPVH